MLSMTIVAFLIVWILALLFSITLGGWIHLLPLAAAPLLVARMSRTDPDSLAFAKWKLSRARRLRR